MSKTGASRIARQYESNAAFETRLRKRITKLILLSVAIWVAVLFGFPMYFMGVSAFKAESEILATPFRWLPEEFVGAAHYERAFDIAPIGQWYANSVFIAAGASRGIHLFWRDGWLWLRQIQLSRQTSVIWLDIKHYGGAVSDSIDSPVCAGASVWLAGQLRRFDCAGFIERIRRLYDASVRLQHPRRAIGRGAD